jgi:cytochrome c553
MRNQWKFLALALAAAAPAAFGQDRDALYLRSLAASCAACHGTAGKAAEGSSVPGLAGTDRATMAAQLRAFKAGTRPATIMHQLAKGYSDAQIDQLAGYFAAQQK